MKTRITFKWVSHVLRGMVICTSAVSRVAASVLPMGHASDDAVNLAQWNAVSAELNAPRAALSLLPPELQDIVETADLEADLRQPVVLSYSLAQPEHVDALDAFWVEIIVRHGDSVRMAEFVSLRTTLGTEQGTRDGVFLDWYLWDASASGDCDGGAGGDRLA